jgi:energy-converting hydrogenase A subunit G
MWQEYSIGLLIVLICAVIALIALAFEGDDLHRLLLVDLVEVPSIGIIALLGSDLAEALILPGLVVGIAELMALSQIYLLKEGRADRPQLGLPIEVIELGRAPAILAGFLVCYGVVLSGFTGGAVAALGIVFYFMSRGYREHFELIEMATAVTWAIWIGAFFVFMFMPQHWFLAVMAAGGAILLKVVAKLSLVGTMWRRPHD